MDQYEDEKEHSLEMQFPFIKKVLKEDIKIVPIMVGQLGSDEKLENKYAEILGPYFDK